MHEILTAILMGVIEGLTEFVPVSSTGHLIVAGEALGLGGSKAASFEIFIQLGAVLAVVWEYRRQLVETAAGIGSDRKARRFALAVLIAFLPAAFVGLATHTWIEENLFSPRTVAGALIAGGVAMLAIEWHVRRRGAPGLDDARLTPLTIALWIGLAQVLSLFPGVSRAAATILGGLLAGMSRRAATEFSFYLAIPTLGAACLYSLYKVRDALSTADLVFFGTGLVVAFLTAAVVIRLFLAWVKGHDLKPFAWYRIAFAVVVLLIF